MQHDRGKPRDYRHARKVERGEPSEAEIRELQERLTASGFAYPEDRDHFRDWLRRTAERDLWFFSAFILGNDWLRLGTLHREEVCPFITDFSVSRRKLLMLPMGFLKTTSTSRSVPLHALIQPAKSNIYFPGFNGADTAILLASENIEKARENLAVSRVQAENNDFLYWLWPGVFWANPKAESARWGDTRLDFRRRMVRAEASISAVGIKTGFVGRYFDIIIADDICALEASQNPPLMQRVKKWYRASMTRFADKQLGIYLMPCTHWASNDIYVDVKKDKSFDQMTRSIEEGDPPTPIWPEKYPKEVIEKLRTQMDVIEFTLWFMNKAVPAGYTALDWELLREFGMTDDGQFLVFEETPQDARIKERHERTARNLGFMLPGTNSYAPGLARVRLKAPAGMSEDFYLHMHEKYRQGWIGFGVKKG